MIDFSLDEGSNMNKWLNDKKLTRTITSIKHNLKERKPIHAKFLKRWWKLNLKAIIILNLTWTPLHWNRIARIVNTLIAMEDWGLGVVVIAAWSKHWTWIKSIHNHGNCKNNKTSRVHHIWHHGGFQEESTAIFNNYCWRKQVSQSPKDGLCRISPDELIAT